MGVQRAYGCTTKQQRGYRASMNTMVISAFPGCGKTYLCNHQDELEFNWLNEPKHFSFYNLKSSNYKKTINWEKTYVDKLQGLAGKVDFVFIPRHNEIMQELYNRKIPVIMVLPNNTDKLTEKQRRIIKQQWFGRILLRDNSHIKPLNVWLTRMIANYNEWTSVEYILNQHPSLCYLLRETQYLEDIIAELYEKKEMSSRQYCIPQQAEG